MPLSAGTKLGRDVAHQNYPRRRFEREARLLASLNQPNIATRTD